MKLIKTKHTYKAKDGKEKSCYNFFLVVEINGKEKRIAIEPKSFGAKGDTYKQLNWVAEYVNK